MVSSTKGRPTKQTLVKRLQALEKFVETIARLPKDGERVGRSGRVIEDDAAELESDDAVETYHILVDQARDLTAAGAALARPGQPSGYGEECVIRTQGGAQLRASAHPQDVSYLRVCDENGIECAYWNMDEIQESPAEVLGAILGCLAGGWNDPSSHSAHLFKLLDRKIVRDWRVSEGEECPRAHRSPYSISADINRIGQMTITVEPTRKHETSRLPGLCAMLEINNGRPELHISTDNGSDNTLHVAAVPNGFDVIPDSDAQTITRCGERERDFHFSADRQ